MKNGGKNKSVVFMILISIIKNKITNVPRAVFKKMITKVKHISTEEEIICLLRGA